MPDIIHLLPDSVANQIAAGEVVDRPASVVKELVENAIDAGATKVQVFIRDAGRTLIQVIDNGKGMSETDARMAFERHATSKISTAQDLYNLHTMGFRGEALASIAAVAQVELKTRRPDDEVGISLQIEASKVIEQRPVACEVGSNFAVRNLFFNLPARRHFLKSDTTEFSHVLTVFNRIALVYPSLAFSLAHNDTLLFNLRSGSLLQRVSDLFGSKVRSSLLPVHAETSLVTIDGFIGRPETATKRGGNQYFFVNGRYMWHPSFHKAILQAYERMLQPSTQPAYYISLTVNPEDVDVNVHPQKTEVKFRNEKALWPILMSTVREALGKFSVVPDIDFDNPIDTSIPAFSSSTQVRKPTTGADPSYNPFKTSSSSSSPSASSFLQRQSLDWESLYRGFERQAKPKEPRQSQLNTNPSPSSAPASAIGEGSASASEPIRSDFIQFRDKYIVTVVKSGLMLIDQHRAHVRVLYEKFLRQFSRRQGTSQRLLFPERVELTLEEVSAIRSVQPQLADVGFEILTSDQSVQVTAVPSELGENANLTVVLRDVADKVLTDDIQSDDLAHKMALSLAHSSAIPYGKTLSPSELSGLTASLFSCQNCNNTPDGHPILFVLSDDELLSRFK